MTDAIPDTLVPRIVTWALPRAALDDDKRGRGSVVREAWKMLALFGCRVNSKQAAEMMEVAINHVSWNAVPEPPHVLVNRIEILKAMCQSARALTKGPAKALAKLVLQLIRERKQDYDYRHAIELLCQIAIFGGDSIKAMLKAELYLAGKPLNAIELQVADVFGHDGKFTRLDEAAHRIAKNLQLQVQRLNKDEEAKPVDFTLFTVNATKDDKTTVVSMVEAMDVAAIFKYRASLSPKALSTIVNAILKAIRDPENILANKYTMVECLSQIGDVCTNFMVKKIAKTLLPLARGNVLEPTITMTAAESANPLNPFKMASGNPKEVQASQYTHWRC
jgi:hypothetical protein